MYSKETTKNYFSLVDKINKKRKGLFTAKELASILEVSEPTMLNFLNKKIIRFDLLEQVGALVGYDFWFDLTLKD
jgi:Mn-dependent DtxR family transcriptional regulator